MGVDEILDNVRERLQDPTIRWSLVGVVTLILLRFRLVLFAAALPVLVYWHYSGEQNAEEDDQETIKERVPIPPKRDHHASEGREDDSDDDFEFRGKPNTDVDTANPYDDSFWDDKPRQRPQHQGREDDSDDAFEFRGKPNMDQGLSQPPVRARDNDHLDDERTGHRGGGFDPGLDFNGLDPELKTSMKGDDDLGIGSYLGSADSLDLGGASLDFGGLNDMSFLTSSLDDMSFMGSDRGGKGGKGKGKGKGKNDGGKGKGEKGERRQDPRQLFVAGIGSTDEDDIREFFSEHGEIERVKVPRNDMGDSKGYCFVTFSTEEEAERVSRLRDLQIGGRRVTIRLADSGRGEKGDKNEGKGGRGKGGFNESRGFGDAPRRNRDFDEPPQRNQDFDDPPPRNQQRDQDFDDPPQRDSLEAPSSRGPVSTDKETDREPVDDLDHIILEALSEEEGPLKLSDFDAGAKRFLEALRSKDGDRAIEALEDVLEKTRSKKRDSVRKWPAYVYTLLQKFDKNLADELAEQNIMRKMQERDARRAGTAPLRSDVARAIALAPPKEEGSRQLIDRWGKPVVVFE